MHMVDEPVPVARNREPTEPHAEHDQQDDADPKPRHHHRHHQRRANELIERAVFPQRRDDPEREGDHDRQERGPKNEQHRDREAVAKERRNAHPELDGVSEIQLRKIAQIDHVLLPEGLVQPKLAIERGDRVRAGIRAQHDPCRVPGDGLDQQERDQRDPEEHRDHLHQPPHNVLSTTHVRPLAVSRKQQAPRYLEACCLQLEACR
jgi:hypothetical protein